MGGSRGEQAQAPDLGVPPRKKEMINDLTTTALTGIEYCLVYQPLILSPPFLVTLNLFPL
jgi:hypothetical protein